MASRLYPDSGPDPALFQSPHAMMQIPAPLQVHLPQSPELDLKLSTPTNDMKQFFSAVGQTASLEIQSWARVLATGQASAADPSGFSMSILNAFEALDVQTDTRALDLGEYARIIESHHALFHKAKKADADLHGREDDLSNSAAQKFAAMDREVAGVRQCMQQQEQNCKVLFDQLAFDIKGKVIDIEPNFGRLHQGRWVEPIGKEVEKHAGAFTLLAGQASATDQHVQGQGWTVLDITVAHIRLWEAEAVQRQTGRIAHNLDLHDVLLRVASNPSVFTHTYRVASPK